MPGVGGRARKVASWPPGDPFPTPAQWSPDSAQLVIARGQFVGPWLETLTLASGVSRKLPLPQRPRTNTILDISWSPDGRWLAYGRSLSNFAATSELWLTRTSDGVSLQITDGTRREWSPTWPLDSRGLYFVSDRGGTADLWRCMINNNGQPEGAPQPVTAGIEMIRAVVCADGKRLAYTKGRNVRNIFRAPILTGHSAIWKDVTQLTFDEAEFESLDVSRDGRIIVSSDRSGNWDVWTLSASGGDLQQLTTDPAVDAGPRWMPDGSEVVFYSSRTGHREVWIMPIGGGPARQVTRGESESIYMALSPNGREIVKEGDGLSVVPAQGGEARRLTSDSRDIHPDWSPDGHWVAFDSSRGGPRCVWRVAASGGQPEPLTKGAGSLPRWSLDGKLVYRAIDPVGSTRTFQLYVAGRDHPLRQPARRFLKRVRADELEACTCPRPAQPA